MTNNIEITLDVVRNLILEQFPQWSNLPIKPVELSGWDNRTFRLGDEMLIRLPSAEGYVVQVLKEQKWLPKLANNLSVQIPTPIALGKPSELYPWSFSIYNWIEGNSANSIKIEEKYLEGIALQLANFLNELHKIDIINGPLAGKHNYFRGATLSVYEEEAKKAIENLKDLINYEKSLLIWKKAVESKWEKDPVWIHGDFSSGNIILKDNILKAVIDFGCMGVGDPACDLVIAWTYLKNSSREIFKSNVKVDDKTWERARGWALWKALITLDSYDNKTDNKSLEQIKIIEDILAEY